MNKYFTKFISLSTIFSGFFFGNLSAIAQIQTIPKAEELGLLMGKYMCQSLIETGTMDDDRMMGNFAEEIVRKYGEEKATSIMEKLDVVFANEDITDDEYGLNLMRGVFQTIINEEDCFKSFLKYSFN